MPSYRVAVVEIVREHFEFDVKAATEQEAKEKALALATLGDQSAVYAEVEQRVVEDARVLQPKEAS